MLQYKLLKNNSGVVVIGSYTDLDALVDVVHQIDQASPLSISGDVLMMLVADARKSKERRREVYAPPDYYPEVGPRYGFKVLWPLLIAQQRLLRESLAYMDSTRQQQSVVYGLENLVEQAIKEAFPKSSVELLGIADTLCARDTVFESRVFPRCAVFCQWSKAERAKYIVNLVASLEAAYDFRYGYLSDESKSAVGYLPNEMFAPYEGQEWCDPRW